MPADPTVLEEARVLVAKAGMADFVPTSAVPVSTGGSPVAIAMIDPVVRSPGTLNFDTPDPDRPGVVRSASILDALRAGTPLPPLLLFQRTGELRYELLEGFHRFHLFAALGYTHVPANVTNWKLGEY
ncbi:hypothetical protein [Burkholderia sp. WTPI3]|uniref:hypothetical protein n=1 Tax=Burkholderia sp. WTPI3 TaxID=2822167 RepID=UPI001F17459C|nr:hypothetical protein [Burkholderia sp. WTPI3]